MSAVDWPHLPDCLLFECDSCGRPDWWGRDLESAPRPPGHYRCPYGCGGLMVPTLERDRLRVLRWIKEKRRQRFAVRDCWRDLTRSFGDDMERFWPVLDHMERGGLIRRVPPEPRTGPGRKPSPVYAVVDTEIEHPTDLEVERLRREVEELRARAVDPELPPDPAALESSLGIAPWCTVCESRRVPGGGLCRACLADEARQ